MNNEFLIEARHLRKSFDTKMKGIIGLRKKNPLKIYAVDDVTFKLKKGEIIGFIGESGCGKSTTARILLKLVNVDQGELIYKGRNITKLQNSDLQEYRRKIQIVFQDPYEYLNPRMNILDIITEPLIINKIIKKANDKVSIATKCLEDVGLSPGTNYLYRYSHELSGGQRQRVAIARALVMKPELVVADEPTSMLDVSVRAGILNLLLKLKQEYELSMVFITHDIKTAGYMCDRIAVMYKGRIVEIGPKKEIIYNPKHPYTKALVGVALNLEDFMMHKDEIIKDGEVDNYVKNEFCSFEKRCVVCDDECRQHKNYEMIEVGYEHYVACCKCMS